MRTLRLRDISKTVWGMSKGVRARIHALIPLPWTPLTITADHHFTFIHNGCLHRRLTSLLVPGISEGRNVFLVFWRRQGSVVKKHLYRVTQTWLTFLLICYWITLKTRLYFFIMGTVTSSQQSCKESRLHINSTEDYSHSVWAGSFFFSFCMSA